MYPPELTAPMAKELVDAGFQELKTAEEVDTVVNTRGTALVVVNSVCGCAARNARPAVRMAVSESAVKPDKITTVFAGVDGEAVAQARAFMVPYPPSSPCIALFKNGELVHMIERHHIEGRPAEMIAENLMAAFDEYCSN